MFNSIAESIKALADFGRSLFEKFKTDKEKQSETVVIKDRANLKKASDTTEKMCWVIREFFAADSQFTMWIARLFYDDLNKDEKRLFKRFYKQKQKLKKQIEKLQKDFEKVN